jgi:hypothetical protein
VVAMMGLTQINVLGQIFPRELRKPHQYTPVSPT